MYPYLTGSASWYLLTMLTQALGIRGQLGDLVLEPKLVREQFHAEGWASALTRFAGRTLRVTYHNPDRLCWDEYTIIGMQLDGEVLPLDAGRSTLLPRSSITALAADRVHTLDLFLGERP